MITGRPTKYNPSFCDIVIKYMSKGHSKMAVAGKLGISRDTLYEWCRKYPDFSDSIKRGEAKSYQFWEETGMKLLFGKIKGGKPSVWIFTMKSRFGWRDNVATTTPDVEIEETDVKTHEEPQLTLMQIVEKYKDYSSPTLTS